MDASGDATGRQSNTTVARSAVHMSQRVHTCRGCALPGTCLAWSPRAHRRQVARRGRRVRATRGRRDSLAPQLKPVKFNSDAQHSKVINETY
ncbi:unnamed protein product [Arctia plantaginis]|uniref:Uncharacterized protein n=1 Tax=Arctia plantaginis TaxID=874455 RepID=A0A8S1B672_ARCPL|nr:unnamed protein product [Arctia plantaginis]